MAPAESATREDRYSEILRRSTEDGIVRLPSAILDQPVITKPTELENYKQEQMYVAKHPSNAEAVDERTERQIQTVLQPAAQLSLEERWTGSATNKPVEISKDRGVELDR